MEGKCKHVSDDKMTEDYKSCPDSPSTLNLLRLNTSHKDTNFVT